MREKEEYSHGLSEREMQSLSAICGTVIPSVPIEKFHEVTGKEDPPSKTLEAFYQASASEFPVPDEVPSLSLSRFIFSGFSLIDFFLCQIWIGQYYVVVIFSVKQRLFFYISMMHVEQLS